MSAEEFQKRIADLVFSAKEHVKALQKEQDKTEELHADWEETDQEDDEPVVIDNAEKINAIEAALDHLESAVDELDGALDD